MEQPAETPSISRRRKALRHSAPGPLRPVTGASCVMNAQAIVFVVMFIRDYLMDRKAHICELKISSNVINGQW